MWATKIWQALQQANQGRPVLVSTEAMAEVFHITPEDAQATLERLQAYGYLRIAEESVAPWLYVQPLGGRQPAHVRTLLSPTIVDSMQLNRNQERAYRKDVEKNHREHLHEPHNLRWWLERGPGARMIYGKTYSSYTPRRSHNRGIERGNLDWWWRVEGESGNLIGALEAG